MCWPSWRLIVLICKGYEAETGADLHTDMKPVFNSCHRLSAPLCFLCLFYNQKSVNVATLLTVLEKSFCWVISGESHLIWFDLIFFFFFVDSLSCTFHSESIYVKALSNLTRRVHNNLSISTDWEWVVRTTEWSECFSWYILRKRMKNILVLFFQRKLFFSVSHTFPTPTGQPVIIPSRPPPQKKNHFVLDLIFTIK